MSENRTQNPGVSMSKREVLWANALVGVLALVLMGSLQACDGLGSNFLEEPPGQDITQDTVFTDPLSARRFLWRAYRTLPYGPGEVSGPYDKRQVQYDMLASLTDINHSFLPSGGARKSYYSPTGIPYSSHQTKYHYDNSGAWAGIRQAYIFLENIGRVPNMTTGTKERLKAEARMIIALHYTELFRNFGGMPWINQPYQPNEDLDTPRMTARATLDSTVAMIDEAIPALPFALDNPSSEAGRFTQAGAMGLKCRLLLFGASPLFNDSQPYMQGEAASEEMVWYGGYDPSLWQRAADACGALIDEVETSSGEYRLVDTGNPRQDFQNAYYERESPEVLISTRVRYRAPSGVGGCDFGCSYYFGSIMNGGAGATTQNYVSMFPMADGTPIDDPDSGYDPQNPYENRDPRLYETVLVNGDEYRDRTAELWIGGRERPNINTRPTASGYRMRKYVLDGVSAFGTVVHFAYLRLPEIYLSYAEALNEANGGPTAEAYEYVNRVRNRVDLDDLPSGLSQEEFREAVLRERTLELGYEVVRWWDLIRWKREEDLTKPLYGMNICRRGETPASVCNADGYGSRELIYDRFRLPTRVWQTNWSPQWYLSAFPLEEVNKVDGMIQNPGWE